MATCRKCGGLLVEGLADDPLIDFDDKSLGESVWVCGHCGRSHYDDLLAERKYSTERSAVHTNFRRAEHDAHKSEHGCNCGPPAKPPTNREHNARVVAKGKVKAKRKAS